MMTQEYNESIRLSQLWDSKMSLYQTFDKQVLKLKEEKWPLL
jgi:hypothetical protein